MPWGGQFDWPEGSRHLDFILLQKLGELSSCDVYSLRIALRQHGINVNNVERSTQDMWDNISAERFHQVEDMIESFHTTIGGELCSLSV